MLFYLYNTIIYDAFSGFSEFSEFKQQVKSTRFTVCLKRLLPLLDRYRKMCKHREAPALSTAQINRNMIIWQLLPSALKPPHSHLLHHAYTPLQPLNTNTRHTFCLSVMAIMSSMQMPNISHYHYMTSVLYLPLFLV